MFSNETQSKKSQNQLTFMVDLETRENYIEFLRVIKILGMNKDKYHYLLVTLVNFLSLPPNCIN